jgi:hypothetical protein
VKYRRMPIEEESPEQLGYERIRFNLTESSVRDRSLADLGIDLGDMLLFYGDHAGADSLRELIAAQSGGAGSGVTTCSSRRAPPRHSSSSPPHCSTRAIISS